jgi:predicted aldo/keto reductase-like oxidoreductase
LLQRVIPILHQTFQEYDDETAGLLQAFFVAYGQAVRWAVAKNTRQQVMQQQSKNAAAHDNDTTLKLSPDSKLQEYGLRFVLEHQGGIVDKVIVGAASAQEVVENATTVSNWTSKKEPTTKAV